MSEPKFLPPEGGNRKQLKVFAFLIFILPPLFYLFLYVVSPASEYFDNVRCGLHVIANLSCDYRYIP